MFSEIQKLLDRNFAIAYALPAAYFLGLTSFLLEIMGIVDLSLYNTLQVTVTGTALATFFAWVTGVALSVLNRPITMLLEGYGDWHPLKRARSAEIERFQQAYEKIKRIRNDDEKVDWEGIPGAELRDAWYALRQNFPYERQDENDGHFSAEYIMPTRLGNIIKAAEVYVYWMYGIDPIEGWARLIAVVPEDYRAQITATKASLDLWINTWFLGIILLIEVAIFLFLAHDPNVVLLVVTVVGIIGVTKFAQWQAYAAAKVWGIFFKATYDLYLPKLAEALKLQVPTSVSDARLFWRNYSSAVMYGSHHYLELLERYRVDRPEASESMTSPDPSFE